GQGSQPGERTPPTVRRGARKTSCVRSPRSGARDLQLVASTSDAQGGSTNVYATNTTTKGSQLDDRTYRKHVHLRKAAHATSSLLRYSRGTTGCPALALVPPAEPERRRRSTSAVVPRHQGQPSAA